MGTVAILGAGVMGETLLSGLIRSGRSADDLVVTARRPERVDDLVARYGVRAMSNIEAAEAADEVTAEDAGKKAREHGMETLEIEVSGPGSGRESALRALQAVGFAITAIRDMTPIPHNGCRPRKRRRV